MHDLAVPALARGQFEQVPTVGRAASVLRGQGDRDRGARGTKVASEADEASTRSDIELKF